MRSLACGGSEASCISSYSWNFSTRESTTNETILLPEQPPTIVTMLLRWSLLWPSAAKPQQFLHSPLIGPAGMKIITVEVPNSLS